MPDARTAHTPGKQSSGEESGEVSASYIAASNSFWSAEGVRKPLIHLPTLPPASSAETRQCPHGQCVAVESYDDDLIGCQPVLNITLFAMEDFPLRKHSLLSAGGMRPGRTFPNAARGGETDLNRPVLLPNHPSVPMRRARRCL